MRESNNPIQMALASGSKFFLQGIRRILEDEGSIKIVAEAFDLTGVKKCIKEIRPDFLFIDNRTLDLNIQSQLHFSDDKNCSTKVIVFDTSRREKPFPPNIVYISSEANSEELIEIVRRNVPSNNSTQIKRDDLYRAKNKLTNRETDIVNLIKIGLSNKKIAKRLSIRERTVKANLTNIFAKLDIQSRYQLMVQAMRPVSNYTSEHKFSKTY